MRKIMSNVFAVFYSSYSSSSSANAEKSEICFVICFMICFEMESWTYSDQEMAVEIYQIPDQKA